jgi:HD-GYP domain-containing protein (c-di-GMP phosphodiesterase class II)
MRLSISLGVSTRLSDEDKINDGLREAEDLMYRNKLFESPSLRSKTVGTVMQTLAERSPLERQHSARVGALCEKLGRELGLQELEVKKLRMGACCTT